MLTLENSRLILFLDDGNVALTNNRYASSPRSSAKLFSPELSHSAKIARACSTDHLLRFSRRDHFAIGPETAASYAPDTMRRWWRAYTAIRSW